MATRAWEALTRWADDERLHEHEDKVLLLLTLVIGAVVGLVVVAFIVVTERLGSRLYPPGGPAWRRLVIPVLGSLVSGFLLYRYFPNARGSGIPQTKTALFIEGGIIRMRTALGKFLCSSISLGSGIALGREGPSVHVGAGLASSLGRRLGLSPSRTKALVPIGASAALAAAFNTPIAAVLFTLEEVMGNLHAPVLGSIVLSSATSWIVLHLLLGDEPLFHVPAYQLVHPLELTFYALLGLLGGLVSVGFVRLLLWFRKRFLDLPRWTLGLQPVAGGLLVGALGWFVPAVVGVGYDHVGEALNGRVALGVMAMLVTLKLVTTAMCYASGNAGGIFGPSLFIGAMLGGAFGGGAHALLPDYTGGTGAYALVGMGVAFAGIIRVPLTSVIMIFEVTRDYSIIVPLMISNLVSYFVSSRLQREPIYEALLHQDGIYLPPGAGAREDFIVVAEGSRPPERVIAASETVEHALSGADAAEGAWPVVDAAGLLVGTITLAQLEDAAGAGRRGAAVAELLAPLDPEEPLSAETFPYLHVDDPLDTAFRRMAQHGLSLLPVVSRTNVRKLVGTIALRDALAAYGLEKRRDSAPQVAIKAERGAPMAALVGGVVALVALLGLGGFLTFYYRSERAARAEQSFEAANRLMQANRYPEAIEQYRSALSISHSLPHRLALGLALVQTGHLAEAEIYLREVVESDANNGPANLGLARIAAQAGELNQAVSHHHRAAVGEWPPNSRRRRIEAHIELVDLLEKAGRGSQARAELLELRTELPRDAELEKRVARMLLRHGLPGEAAEMLAKTLRGNPGDASAHAALGEAELAAGRYEAARDAFRAALRLDPGDEASGRGLSLTDQVLTLDPTRPGLPSAERHRRSRELLSSVLAATERCLAASGRPPSPEVAKRLAAAHGTIADRRRPRSRVEATQRNLELAEVLWSDRMRGCGAPAAGTDEVLDRIMRGLRSGRSATAAREVPAARTRLADAKTMRDRAQAPGGLPQTGGPAFQ